MASHQVLFPLQLHSLSCQVVQMLWMMSVGILSLLRWEIETAEGILHHFQEGH